ncbi:putative nucleoporin, nucleoporin, nucleoporin, subdomain 1 [Helianthus annuus]|uniref:nuclear pore complex protein NUP155-like n=1 Tax=Helianthus annuus TaxID=4232 RepID=UPI000B903A43|nr:nuclear pore complex protein NUP155-like [Helianthus annuus]KAJ0492375.1 putative nucleoporin, nucleoporin, nucleoporin, subdomain 1 [Helianthus annuus]
MTKMSLENDIVMRDIMKASVVVSDRIGRDVSAQLDLEEALEASRYISHPYSTHPSEWPPLVEVVNSRELPSVLIERYNAAGGEGTALCGIFPEIRRAWASVDNSLFLWRFDKWDGQCSEYSDDEQAICAVGLVKPKPEIFLEAIQYLLVLATPVELLLVGVCCSGSGDGSDPYSEVSLQPLPDYTIPSDGVTMTCIACTNTGRIFLAGRDGHIYEMRYTTGSGWYKKSRKVCLTAGLGSIVSRWVVPNVFNFGAVDPVVEMVVDNERHILYARTEEMRIQVYSLGFNGDGPLKKVTEEKNIINQSDLNSGSRQAAGSRPSTRSTKTSIVSISSLSTVESKWLHLVAVLSDGRRMYLSTTKSSGNSGTLSNNVRKPSCLKVVTTRPAPPLGVGGGLSIGPLSFAGRSQNEALSLKIESAHYSPAALVLSGSSLLLVNRDSTTHSSSSSSILGTGVRSSKALRECVSSIPIEGRTLAVAEVLPPRDTASSVQSLYSQLEFIGYDNFGESVEKLAGKLRARGDLPTQHILPRRRIIIFSTTGMTEVAFNRPVDILRRLLESNTPRTILDDFFNQFGPCEAAAMCLMLAARIVNTESFINSIVAEKAAEAFEDPRVVGIPVFSGSGALANTRSASSGFSMGQVVQEAEPVFSGAHEGLCLCTSRLLLPVWEFPVMSSSDAKNENGIVGCRLSVEAMQVLEDKLRSLEKFLRSRSQRRGLYGSILNETGADMMSSDTSMARNVFSPSRNLESSDAGASNKRQRLPYSTAELASMEVRAMECVRQLLLRCGEALFLLQLLSRHHVTRLVQSFDSNTKQSLLQLTFHQLVCSKDGDRLATRLVSALMEYYTGPDGRGTVDDISGRLREGCRSFYKESDYKFYLAVECLERAAAATNNDERETLAREAFSKLTGVPESADLQAVCKRFEDLRFYEAVVRLPLQKASALDSAGDTLNEQIEAGARAHALAQRERCYDIIITALRSLKGEEVSHKEFRSPIRSSAQSSLNPATRKKYICQVIQLGVQSSDKIFHEYLYRALIDIGLEDELLEFGGPDLVPFLQNAMQTKYTELLARYYVLKQQHVLAAHVLLRLAERRSNGLENFLTLDQRRQYLNNAVIQAKSASESDGLPNSVRDSGLLDLLEGKLTVLQFQIRIKEELESVVCKLESAPDNSEAEFLQTVKEKVKELSLDLKSITQLYNEYAVPFELWEICLEMLYFASYSGDTDSSIVRDTWARFTDHALSKGGIAEACSALTRIGSHVYSGDDAVLPLDTLCLHLEKAALDQMVSGAETVGDEDVARALLAACKGSVELVLNTYDQLLTTAAVLLSPTLKLRLLRSVLVVLGEWAGSVSACRMGSSPIGASLVLRGTFSLDQRTAINHGIRDKITSAANRYMTEVTRLALPQSQTESVYSGFKELELSLSTSFSYDRF